MSRNSESVRFYESEHPRGGAGKFATKPRPEADMGADGIDLGVGTGSEKPDPTSPAMTKPKRSVVPIPAWDDRWGYGVDVIEVATVEKVPGMRTTQAVYADGTMIGHLMGRTESANSKRRWWDYQIGETVPSSDERAHMAYGNDSRQMVVSNMLGAAKSQGLLR